MSDNGSCEKRLIKLIIEHVNGFVRRFVPENKRFCLTLDGHKSRNGIDWLHYCEEVGCEVVQLPSDTSHFLQACDNKVNKTFKTSIRSYRDVLSKNSTLDLCSVRVGLILGIFGFESVTERDIKDSFDNCGLWPMDYRFVQRFERSHRMKEQKNSLIARAECAAQNKIMCNIVQRQSDEEVWRDIQRLVSTNKHPSKALQLVEQRLQFHTSVNKILLDSGRGPIRKNDIKKPRAEVLYKGTPARCLTIGDVIEQRETEKRLAEESLKLKEQIKREKQRAREEKC